jgi:predicted S18 family serine protease
MNEAEKYGQYMVLKEKVDLSLDRFEREKDEFSDSISGFIKKKDTWVSYHWLRHESKTISEQEAIHLADVMEISTELLTVFAKSINNTTFFIQSMGDYYKEINKYHESKTSAEVIAHLPQLMNYTEKYFSGAEITMAELKKEWAAVNILKQKVESIFTKYLN